jgi:UDP-glucose 4-epimerase
MHIVLTGAASHLGRVLLPRLCSEAAVTRVTGVDLRRSGFSHPRYREEHLDTRSAGLGRVMEGAEALIHAAFVVMRGDLGRRRHDRALMRSINVDGSIHVLRQAMERGVPRIVHLSSAAVYGAWPGNPERLTETHPLRATHGFAYAEDKVAVETWLDGLAPAAGAPRIVRLRPHVILGPHCQPLLKFLLRQPFYPRFPDPQPLTQCVWEEDVAEAILQSVLSDAEGSFNLAAEPAMSFRAMQQIRHRWPMPAPFELIRAAQHALWHVAGLGGEPGWLQGLPYSLAVDCSRARQTLGWSPRYSVFDCLRALPP